MKKLLFCLLCSLCCIHSASPTTLDDWLNSDDEFSDGDFFDKLFDDGDDFWAPAETLPQHTHITTHHPAPAVQSAKPAIPAPKTTSPDEAFLKALPDDAKKVPPHYRQGLEKYLRGFAERLHNVSAHFASFVLGGEYHRKLEEPAQTIATLASHAERIAAQKVQHLALYHQDFNSLRRHIAQSFDQIDRVVDAYVDLNIPDTLEPLSSKDQRAQRRVFEKSIDLVSRVLAPIEANIVKVSGHARSTQRLTEKQQKYTIREQRIAQTQSQPSYGESHGWGGGGSRNSYGPATSAASYSRQASHYPSAYTPAQDGYDWNAYSQSYNPWGDTYTQGYDAPASSTDSSGSSGYFSTPPELPSFASTSEMAPDDAPPESKGTVFFGEKEEPRTPRQKFSAHVPQLEKRLKSYYTPTSSTSDAQPPSLFELVNDANFSRDISLLAETVGLADDLSSTEPSQQAKLTALKEQLEKSIVDGASFLIDATLFIPSHNERTEEDELDHAQATAAYRTLRIACKAIRKSSLTKAYEALHAALLQKTDTNLKTLEALLEEKEEHLDDATITAALQASMQLHKQPVLVQFSKTPEEKKVAAIHDRRTALMSSLPALITTQITHSEKRLNDLSAEEKAHEEQRVEQLKGLQMIWNHKEAAPVNPPTQPLVESTLKQKQTTSTK